MYKMRMLPALLLLLVFFSCKKETKEEPPQDFYITFTLDDSTYRYRPEGLYRYDCGTVVSHDFGMDPTSNFRTTVAIVRAENANLHPIGFSFRYGVKRFQKEKMTEYGNALFQQGPMAVCYSGLTYITLPYEMSCLGGVGIYWLSANNKYFSSTTEVQPAGSFFSIDEIINQSHGSSPSGYGSYQMILKGRFKCRVFYPADKTIYKDLEGTFRMPAWQHPL